MNLQFAPKGHPQFAFQKTQRRGSPQLVRPTNQARSQSRSLSAVRPLPPRSPPGAFWIACCLFPFLPPFPGVDGVESKARGEPGRFQMSDDLVLVVHVRCLLSLNAALFRAAAGSLASRFRDAAARDLEPSVRDAAIVMGLCSTTDPFRLAASLGGLPEAVPSGVRAGGHPCGLPTRFRVHDVSELVHDRLSIALRTQVGDR